MQNKDGNSDSSYDIVPVPVPLRRHPRAPTTVQIVGDDFDAMTHDVDHETAATEMYQLDGITEVRSVKEGQGEQGEEEVRFSGVYGEWAERHEVYHRQGPTPSEFGRYMEEVTRRLQEITADEQGQWQSPTIKARGGADPRRKLRDEERGGKVKVWREEVARNKTDLGEFGEMGSSSSSAAQRSRERTCTVDQGMIQSRDVQNLKATLRRSQSSASPSQRSEHMYTPSELNSHYPVNPQKSTVTRRVPRARPPSPARSERIYTMAELNALTGQRNSPPRRSALAGQDSQYNRSTHGNSPPQNYQGTRRVSPPSGFGARSTSTSSVEMVLASCQPSLLHIAPVLSSLGIKQEEHLRALARLREETRDRELKEEMLRKGVTVLEWAILMDKLQGW